MVELTAGGGTSTGLDPSIRPKFSQVAGVLSLRWFRGPKARRIGARVVLILAALITVMMLVLAFGMWRNDRTIDGDVVTATATVLKVTPLRTGIEFIDSAGISQRPTDGVLYPGGLRVGQQFLVEYSAADPGLVRVAGRTWLDGVIMPGFVVAGTWVIALPLVFWLRRRGRRPVEPAAS
ncbi:hypothetical protein D1871_13935 [Nakamurella silvestris]|nr:hypothetical protein D1871_13935 [Nakamurella silvestris]